MDAEEVVMLIRAVLASKKHATSFGELQKEYYETNGYGIPFHALGFNSLGQFLQSEPSKFEVCGDTVRPVIDENLAALRKLVTGQKSTSKKKKPPKKYGYTKTSNQSSYNKSYNNNYYNNNSYSNNNTWKKSSFNQPKTSYYVKPAPKPQMIQMRYIPAPRVHTFWTEDDPLPTFKPKPIIDTFAYNKSLIPSLFIKNPDDYLKESLVIVTHVESVHEIYLRLSDTSLSDQFNKLDTEMNVFYEREGEDLSPTQSGLCVDDIYVAYSSFSHHSSVYHRVQIKEFNKSDSLCLFVDYGYKKWISRADLLPIRADFLNVKFQMIKVNLENLDKFAKANDLFKKKLKNYLLHEKFLARQTKPGTIRLFDAEDLCFNEYFANKYKKFISLTPSLGEKFCAVVSYLNEDTNVLYLQLINESRDFFEQQMMKFNEFLNNDANLKRNVIPEMRDVEVGGLYCGKFSVDQVWYRCRVLRRLAGASLVVEFIDYGNKELVQLGDLRFIDDEKFEEFKHLPEQAFPVILKKLSKNEIKELIYESRLVEFKVAKENVDVKTVEIVQILDSDENEEEDEICAQLNELNLEKKCQKSDSDDNSDNLTESESEWKTLVLQPKPVLPQKPVNQTVLIRLNDLKKFNLNFNLGCLVYVSYVENPFNFVLNLEEFKSEKKRMLDEMNEFYEKNEEKFRPKVGDLLLEHVYACKSESGKFFRGCIKKTISIGKVVYNIDDGNFDLITNESIFFMCERFLSLKPMAIAAKLCRLALEANVTSWSQPAKNFFVSLIQEKKSLKAVVFKRDEVDNIYEVDLVNEKGSISQQIAEKKFAKIVKTSLTCS